MNYLKAVIFSIFSFLAILTYTMTFESEQVMANDEICSTFSEISKDCLSIKTNCLCEVVVTPEED